MSINTRTLDALNEQFGVGEGQDEMPPRETLEANGTRYVLVSSVGVDKHTENFPTGFFETMDPESHDWVNGVPEYMVDLYRAPEEALIYLQITVTVSGTRSSIDHMGIEIPA